MLTAEFPYAYTSAPGPGMRAGFPHTMLLRRFAVAPYDRSRAPCTSALLFAPRVCFRVIVELSGLSTAPDASGKLMPYPTIAGPPADLFSVTIEFAMVSVAVAAGSP